MKPAAILVAIAAITLTASTANAQSTVLGADVGVSRFAQEPNPGFGFNLYPGFAMGPLTLEAQLGYHRAAPTDARSRELGLRTTYAPVLAGGRLGVPMGLLTPWVGLHGGFARIVSVRGSASSGVAVERREWEPAFNAGVGVDIGLGLVGVGAGLWYHRVMDDVDGMQIYSATIGLSIGL